MTRARTNANVTAAIGRNMVINGAMNVSQRATSVTDIGSSGGYITCDRWQIASGNTAGRFTMSQTADGPNGISANCIKLDCTTADSSIAAAENLVLQQKFEGQNLQRIGKGIAGAKQITLSFYVKASAAFTFGVELRDRDNDRQITKLYDTTTDWVRHEFTFPADVDDGSSPFDDDNASSLELRFWLHAGSSFAGGTLNSAAFANTTTANRAAGIDSFFSNTANNFFLTGVQLEVGPVATEFEQEDIGVTLRKCQRYFQSYGGDGAFERFGTGYNNSNTVARTSINSLVQTRAVPTISVSDVAHFAVTADNANTQCTAIIAHNMSRNIITLQSTVGSTALASGEGIQLMANNSTAARLLVDAEL